MKKILCFIAIITALFLISCSNHNDVPEKIIQDVKKPISEIHQNLYIDFDEIKNTKYENLNFSDFQPDFPNITEYYNLEMSIDYETLDMEKAYDAFVNQVKRLFPKHNFSEKHIYFSPKDDGEYTRYGNGHPRVVDYKEELFNGSIDTWWFLYESDAEGKTLNDVYLWVDHATLFGVMNKGQGKAVCYPDGFEHINMWEPNEYKTILAQYSIDNVPDKDYVLADGKSMAVNDSVVLVEEFFMNYLPNQTESKIKTVVTGVEVREQNNIAGYRLLLANQYNKIPFDYEYDVNYITNYDDRIIQNATAFVTNSNEVDYFYNLQMWNNIATTGDVIDSIISLDEAIKKTSEILTASVTFEVRDIKFVYCPKGDDIAKVTATAAWKITTYNTNDDKYYHVYVDAQAGNTNFYTSW